MKKLAFRLLIGLVIVVILAVVAVRLSVDGAIKRGVETVGPMLAKVEIKLDSVNLSLLSGSGRVKGLVVGNPEGFKTPSAIRVDNASLSVQPGSVFSDKVVIKSISVQGPEITFETDLKANNLSKILANLQAAAGSATPAKPGEPAKPKETKSGKKLEVDDFLITGGKIHVSLTALEGKSATVPLPEIHLTNLGQGPDGITAGELATIAIQAIEKEAVPASAGAVSDLSKEAAALVKAADAAAKVTKGLGDLFKK
jgi:uncharacterized protein involved in outer membrane biogenesis